jgi:preprotein translocase subunit YajC
MTNCLQILLMAPQGQGSGASSLVVMLLVIVVFYFTMLRPQMKKAKEQKKFREAIKKGDKIVTIGGIHGKILEVFDKAVIIEVEDGGKLRILKDAVSVDNSNLITENK